MLVAANPRASLSGGEEEKRINRFQYETCALFSPPLLLPLHRPYLRVQSERTIEPISVHGGVQVADLFELKLQFPGTRLKAQAVSVST